MESLVEKIGAVQNIGLVDRLLRSLVAVALIFLPAYSLTMTGASFSLSHSLLMLVSVYPALTAILGWDPFYGAVSIRTCGNSDWNQCGTLPFEVNAALGHHPVPSKDYDHSLAGSSH